MDILLNGLLLGFALGLLCAFFGGTRAMNPPARESRSEGGRSLHDDDADDDDDDYDDYG